MVDGLVPIDRFPTVRRWISRPQNSAEFSSDRRCGEARVWSDWTAGRSWGNCGSRSQTWDAKFVLKLQKTLKTLGMNIYMVYDDLWIDKAIFVRCVLKRSKFMGWIRMVYGHPPEWGASFPMDIESHPYGLMDINQWQGTSLFKWPIAIWVHPLDCNVQWFVCCKP